MRLPALLVISLFGAVTCLAWAADQAPAGPTTQPAATVKMTDDMTFQPAALTVTVGTTVRWENASKDEHTVTADPKRAGDAKDVSLPAGAEPFDSGKIKPGGSYSHAFTVPGTYKYVCLPHEDMGMLGQIIVKPAP